MVTGLRKLGEQMTLRCSTNESLAVLISGALLCSALARPAAAQSWAQFKEAATQAQSEKRFPEAEDFWQKAVTASEGVGVRQVQALAGLARCFGTQDKATEAGDTYKKLLGLVAPGDRLSDDARSALVEYSCFLKKHNREAEASELETKYGFSAKDAPVDQATASPVAPAPSASVTSSSTAKTPPAVSPSVQAYEKWYALYKTGAEQQRQKQIAVAEKSFREALGYAEKQKENPACAIQTLTALVVVCSAQGKTSDCEIFAGKKVAAVKQTAGGASVDFAQALADHATWLRKLNRKPEAMAEEAKAEEIMAKNATVPPGGSGGRGTAAPGAVDVSGTKGGSIYSRARSLQGGYVNRINDLLNE